MSYIAESQTGLYLETSKFTVIAVLNLNKDFMVIMKSFTWVTSFWQFFREKPSSYDILSIVLYGKTLYLGKMSTKIMDFFIDTIFWSMIDDFNGVLIGLELREFDRMCGVR